MMHTGSMSFVDVADTFVYFHGFILANIGSIYV